MDNNLTKEKISLPDKEKEEIISSEQKDYSLEKKDDAKDAEVAQGDSIKDSEPASKEMSAVKQEIQQKTETQEKKKEVLKEIVTDCFRKLILQKPNDKTREEIKKKLMSISEIDDIKFDYIDKQANILRDKIVALMEIKKLDIKICNDTEDWLKLIFDDKDSRIFCKQEAKRLADEFLKELL